jgi:predicted  nucleic acid-binding Zn-ribbon protein
MVEALQAKLDKAHHELQAANYRVGYLENQVTERERDIQELDGTLKLLTDSQHKGGWWARFSSWFFGRG